MTTHDGGEASDASQAEPSASEIREWIADWLSQELEIEREDIDFDLPVTALGLDSMKLLVLIGQLERWLGFQFQQNPFEEFRTISELSEFLATGRKGCD